MTVVDANDVSQATPVALAMTTSDDLYVLPSAFTVVPTAGPSISSVSGSTDASGNTTVTLKGDNLGLDTRVLFDGAAATSTQKNDDGSFAVTAPPAIGNHVAVLEALASDGQTSMQTMGALPPPTFTYASATNPSISITPATVTIGTDTMIEVDGIDTNFAEGRTVIGSGSSDVIVRRTWIINSGKALLNISINPSALAGLTTVTAATGVQAVTLKAGLQILPGGSAADQPSRTSPQSGHRPHGRAGRRNRGPIRHGTAPRSERLDAHHRRREEWSSRSTPTRTFSQWYRSRRLWVPRSCA